MHPLCLGTTIRVFIRVGMDFLHCQAVKYSGMDVFLKLSQKNDEF
jgi:hypothetical protein